MPTVLLTLAALVIASSLAMHRHAVTARPADDSARLAELLAWLGRLLVVLAVAAAVRNTAPLLIAVAMMALAASALVGITTYGPHAEAHSVRDNGS